MLLAFAKSFPVNAVRRKGKTKQLSLSQDGHIIEYQGMVNGNVTMRFEARFFSYKLLNNQQFQKLLKFTCDVFFKTPFIYLENTITS